MLGLQPYNTLLRCSVVSHVRLSQRNAYKYRHQLDVDVQKIWINAIISKKASPYIYLHIQQPVFRYIYL